MAFNRNFYKTVPDLKQILDYKQYLKPIEPKEEKEEVITEYDYYLLLEEKFKNMNSNKDESGNSNIQLLRVEPSKVIGDDNRLESSPRSICDSTK